MLRILIAMISFLSLTARAADSPSGGGAGGGGSGEGGGGSGGSMMVPAYFTALGKKECDDEFACMATFPADTGVTFTEEFGANVTACYADAAMYYDAAAVQSSVTAGRIAFDVASAAACIGGIPAPVCASYWTQGSPYPAACDKALVGKVADGGACTVDFDCVNSESICDETTKKCGPAPAQARDAAPADGFAMHPKLRFGSR
jgi:hypothetical protein